MSVTNQVAFESCRIGIGSLALGVGLSAMDYARDVRISSIYEDTGDIQKVIIARELFHEAG